MSAPTATGADEGQLADFIDGRFVWSGAGPETPRSAASDPSGQRARPDVTDLLDRCAGGLARWLAIGESARRRVLADVAIEMRQWTFDVAETIADELGISCEFAVRSVSDAIEALQRACSEPLHLPAHARVGLHLLLPELPPGRGALIRVIAPVLISGSTIVVRPRPGRSTACSMLAASLSAAGLPDGTLNVIHGDDSAGIELIRHEAIAGVLAIGSPAHLAFVARAALPSRKPVVLRTAAVS